jgi:UDP-N-acetylglucosamine 2-epimerase (non-hydrolysing)
VLAHYHFAPTVAAQESLKGEGVPESSIHMVGNTVIDALLGMVSRDSLPWPLGVPLPKGEDRLVLLTLHRRENFGEPFRRILGSLKVFAENHPRTHLVYPVHPNPNVVQPAREILGGLPNVHLLDPIEYPSLVALLGAAYAVFTDSGGLQEESPALGKPVLVFREVTERPEAVEAGSVRLVGSDPAAFLSEAELLWADPGHYAAMAVPRFPYGDGTAGMQIADILARDLA